MGWWVKTSGNTTLFETTPPNSSTDSASPVDLHCYALPALPVLNRLPGFGVLLSHKMAFFILFCSSIGFVNSWSLAGMCNTGDCLGYCWLALLFGEGTCRTTPLGFAFIYFMIRPEGAPFCFCRFSGSACRVLHCGFYQILALPGMRDLLITLVV